jgi:hypothetical protein
MIFRTRRIRRWVDEYYWEGFFARMGGGIGPESPLEIVGMTTMNEVRNIAYRAGWLFAESAIEVHSKRRFGTGLTRRIPAAVYAEAFAAR